MGDIVRWRSGWFLEFFLLRFEGLGEEMEMEMEMDVLCRWKMWRIKDGRMMNAVEIYIYIRNHIYYTDLYHAQ